MIKDCHHFMKFKTRTLQLRSTVNQAKEVEPWNGISLGSRVKAVEGCASTQTNLDKMGYTRSRAWRLKSG